MTHDQFDRAKPFVDQMVPLKEMLHNLTKSKPEIVVKWGGRELPLCSFSSPDSNRTLTEAIKSEIQSRIKALEESLSKL